MVEDTDGDVLADNVLTNSVDEARMEDKEFS